MFVFPHLLPTLFDHASHDLTSVFFYPEPRGPRVLPVGELVLWYGMFAPCGRFLGTTGFARGAPCNDGIFNPPSPLNKREGGGKLLQIERVGKGIAKILQRYLITLTTHNDKL